MVQNIENHIFINRKELVVDITISEGMGKKLKALALEAGVSPIQFVEELIYLEDNSRHQVWSRSQQKFLRTKCGRALCREENIVPLSDRAD